MAYFCYQENNKCTCYLYMITSVLIIIATSIIVKNKKNNNYCCCSWGFFMLLKYIFLDAILISQDCKKTYLCWRMDVFITANISFCIPLLSHLSPWSSYQVIFVNYKQWNVVLLSKENNKCSIRVNQLVSARTAKNTQKDAFSFLVCRRPHIPILSHLPHRMNYKYEDSTI